MTVFNERAVLSVMVFADDVRRSEISLRKAAALVVAAILAGTGLTLPGMFPAEADPSDYWVVAGDQASNRLIAFDPDVSDWDSSAAVMWTWEPTTALGFSSAEISAFGYATDFKLRNTAQGQRFVVSASNGLAAIVSYPSGNKVWAVVAPGSANVHSAELLPNGNIAVAASHGDWVRVYASSQGSGASNYAQWDLAHAHGTVWDPVTERLWVNGLDETTGDRILTALAITGSDADPKLAEDTRRRVVLPDIGPHDLSADPTDPHRLLLSTAYTTFEFDTVTETFTEFAPSSGGLDYVKSINRQPSGQLVQTRADAYKTPQGACATTNTWCTDTVDFYNPDFTRTRTGAAFYKARVWSPFYSAIGDSVHGPVEDRQLDSGGWSSPATIDTNDSVSAISAAALPDGTMHVQTLLPGLGVWDRVRSSSGTWSSATKIDSNPSITAISAAALPDGTMHVQTLVPGSGVWDRVRSSSGTWSSATKISDACLSPSDNPCVTDVSAAAAADGSLLVQMLFPGDGVWSKTRSPSGSWSSESKIDWNGSITRISSSGRGDGTVHVQTVIPGLGLWDRTRSTGGNWSSATKLDANEGYYDIYSAGLTDGTMHVGSGSFEP